jgi:hypothetical protein
VVFGIPILITMVEISLSTDLLSSETEITSIIVFVAMTDSKWESIPLQHRINNEWEATVKVVLKRSIPRRYYYFVCKFYL